MRCIREHSGLTLAVLLTLFLALARYRGGSAGIAKAPPAPLVEAPQPAAPVVKPKSAPRRKLVAKRVKPAASPVEVRGAQLRDKGEALGGGTPDRVDTGTMTVRGAQ